MENSSPYRLGESEWYRTLYEKQPCIYFVLDRELRVFSINQFGADCLGYHRQELINQPIFMVFNTEDRPRLQAELSAVAGPPTLYNCSIWESRLVGKDGRILWVKATARTVSEVEGEWLINSDRKAESEDATDTGEQTAKLPNYQWPVILLICENIATRTSPTSRPRRTFLKRPGQVLIALAKKAFKSSNFESLIQEITQVAVYSLDLEQASLWFFRPNDLHLHCLDICNAIGEHECSDLELFLSDFGLTPTDKQPQIQLISAQFNRLNLPLWVDNKLTGIFSIERTSNLGNWSEAEQDFAIALSECVTLSWEKAGQPHPETEPLFETLTIADPLSTPAGLPLPLSATIRDSERWFRAIFNSSFQWAGLLKPDGTVLEINQTALDFGGLQLNEVQNKLFWEIPWWVLSERSQETLKTATLTATKGEFVRHEVEILMANQQVATLDFSIKPIQDETGRVLLLLAEGRDITASKQAEITLRLQAERERLISQIQARIRSSLDLDAVLKTTVAEVRQFLATDRVLIFCFRPDWSAEVVVESVAAGWISILKQSFHDPCFGQSYVGLYQKGRVRAINNIYQANLNECHINLLSSCQVKANLVVPIIQSEPTLQTSTSKPQSRLWGLLIAHHCAEPRHWQEWEMELLKQLATQVAIAIDQSQLYQQLQAANRELQHLASLDGLTKVGNRRRFDEILSQEWQRMKAEPMRLSLILGDIDCFKAYNDTYGHQAGDVCLQQVAKAIDEICVESSTDNLYFVARYGGEEFAVILPNANLKEAVAVAEGIRQRVKALAIPHQHSPRGYITLSLGVASTCLAKGSSDQLIAEADRSLYEAKSQGRDCVINASEFSS